MASCAFRKARDVLCLNLIVLLAEISGRDTLNLFGLPGTGNVAENAASGTEVYAFSVNLTSHLLPNISVATGYPVLINSNPLTKAFRINPVAPLLYKVVTTGDPVLDYETMPNAFELQVLVSDSAGAVDLQILTVQVLDVNEPPVFQGNLANQTAVVYILENSLPGIIYKIHAVDPENRPSREVNFSLTPASPLFMISPTGEISTLKRFDFEKDPTSHALNITITDHLGLNISRTVLVNIINTNDESPYFTMEKKVFRLFEEKPPGSFVANITAKDPDGEAFIHGLRFSLTVSEGIPNFYINPISGQILVAGRIDRDADSFRAHSNISLIVRVEDSPTHEQSDETEIVIIIEDINDNPPKCDLYNYRIQISEKDSPGLEIINLRNHCQDNDAESPNNLFNFTGLSGVGSEKFTQDPPHSGIIKLTGNVDLENTTDGSVRKQYLLNIVIQDISLPYFTENIYIYIRIQPKNEFDPVFSSSSYIFNVSELDPAGSKIGGVFATDKDLPSTGITYSISFGESGLDVGNLFLIHPQLGTLQNLKRLDYEERQSHLLRVRASDNEGRTSSSSVTINVLEANDEPPNCSPNSQILEIPVGLPSGTNIGGFSVTCTDRDSSPRSFRYTITSGNVNNHFIFSPQAGSNISRLILATPFDYKTGLDRVWEYRLLVSVTDNNLLPGAKRPTVLIQTGTVTLTVRVIPEPTTVVPTTPGVTVVTSRENVYSPSAWYVPFFIAFGSLLLLGFLGYLTFLLAKYLRSLCPPKPKADEKPLINMKDKKAKKTKKEIVWEMTNLNPVFDGEARDPVTGKWYEYNLKSGARRWKDTDVPSKTEANDLVEVTTPKSQEDLHKGEAETGGNQGDLEKKLRPSKSGQKDLPKTEAETGGNQGDLEKKLRPPKSGQKDLPKTEAETGGNQGDLEKKLRPPKSGQRDLLKTETGTRKQNHTEPRVTDKKPGSSPDGSQKLEKAREEPPSKRSSSSLPQRKSPIPSPKIYPRYQNQS